MTPGSTFKILGDGADDHLWMIISDPCPKTGKQVLVNLTGWQRVFDQTCIVEIGEHPYVRKRSLIYYPKPRLYPPTYIDKLNNAGLLKIREPLSPDLLKRIQRGSIASPHFPIGPKQIMKAQYGHLLGDTES